MLYSSLFFFIICGLPIVNSQHDIQQLVDALVKMDTQIPKYIELNWGKMVDGDKRVSKESLYEDFDRSVLDYIQYTALADIYDHQVFTESVCSEDPPMIGFRRKFIYQMFTALTRTPVFNLTLQFLQNKKVAGDWEDFKEELWSFWFGKYSRCNDTSILGSSGWEHVFVGEWKDGIVEGHHNWFGYSKREKENDIIYHGYIHYYEQTVATIQYEWNGNLKKIGGFFLKTSPAFDFSIYTACALVYPGSENCKFRIDEYPVKITTFTQPCATGKCLLTAYPSG